MDGTSPGQSATAAVQEQKTATVPSGTAHASTGATVTPADANVPQETPVIANPPGTAAAPANPSAATSVAAAAAAADEEAMRNQKLVEEFQYLLEKSQSLFSGLRDLPPTGSHRQWRPYFEKTFEVYTKLWKFQQSHRPILENKNNYGLKRWEVGEIASKIGQLYYHYYLRTSETNYLHEAYVFYDAIHERQYFKDILEVKNPALMIKKMRYYARFVVVCLLLNMGDNIRSLIAELEGLIADYTKSFKPPDAKEWQLVLDEISTFMEAEKKLVPIRTDRTPFTIEHRLPPVSNSASGENPKLRLQEAILVGNYQKQIKFSELTLDMYRMLQSLERQPVSSKQILQTKLLDTTADSHEKDPVTPGSTSRDEPPQLANAPSANSSTPVPGQPVQPQAQQVQINDKTATKRSNPHKYLLYRPSLSQLLVYIATAYKDTGDNAAMMLYVSADGCVNMDTRLPGYEGGVATSLRKTMAERAESSSTTVAPVQTTAAAPVAPIAAAIAATAPATNTIAGSPTSATASTTPGGNPVTSASATTQLSVNAPTPATIPSIHCLHPADLTPFTRKPLFVIVDSSNSVAFKSIPNIFDQPVMCLMSPMEYPSSVQDKSEIGSLFTLFLHTPLLGFCSVSDIGNLDQAKWDGCLTMITTMEQRIGDLLMKDTSIHAHIKRFMTDDFLWTFIVRFVLCGFVLRHHSSFVKMEKSFPTSTPAIHDDFYRSEDIITMLRELTMAADVSTYFTLPFPAAAHPMVTS